MELLATAIRGVFYIIGGITAAVFIAPLYGFGADLLKSQSLAKEGANLNFNQKETLLS